MNQRSNGSKQILKKYLNNNLVCYINMYVITWFMRGEKKYVAFKHMQIILQTVESIMSKLELSLIIIMNINI